jgi:pyruvate,water dikinase
MEPWIVGSEPSERYPLWTRANVGEVFPDPVAPLSFTLLMREQVEGAWRDSLARMGAFTHDEFAPGEMETLGVFGGYCYLNAAVTRILGERAPGLSAQAMDDLFFGAQPGIPPYAEQPGDHNEERTAAIGETFGWVMSVKHLDEPAADAVVVDKLRAARPNLEAMSNTELWAYARDLLLTHFRKLFGEHIFITFLSPVPVGALSQTCAAVGRPEDTMRVISGVGDVESAAPSLAMWQLGRTVAADPALTAAFDGGLSGLQERLAKAGPAGERFLADFSDFLYKFGSRGPNEWELRNHTWETRPELALAAIDRMRLAGPEADPEVRNRQMAAERERIVSEISAMLAGDPETQGLFQAAARAAVVFQAGRERTKTNNIKLIHEARMAMHLIGRRLVEAGLADDVSDFGLLKAGEIDGWLADSAPLREQIRRRRELFHTYAALQEPFVVTRAVLAAVRDDSGGSFVGAVTTRFHACASAACWRGVSVLHAPLDAPNA